MTSQFKRTWSYWEPIYSPATNFDKFKEFDWNFQNVSAVKNLYCQAKNLELLIEKSSRFKIKNFKFESCDFVGDFNFTKITFADCTFEDCDLGDNIWVNAKFSKCHFTNCSFSTVTFKSSQFIECQWKNIGISSNEMHFINCLLTNPNKFIAAAYTNTDKEIISQRAQATPAYQKSRLEGTKAKAARMILSNLQLVGDDDAFYDAVKCYTTQVLVAKIFALKQKIESNPSHTKLITYTLLIIGLHLELIILTLSGHINGWGSSVGRSAGFGLFIATIFTCIYYIFNIATTLPLSVLTSLEITLLVGYTKYSTDKLPLLHQYLFALNMLLGVWWYSIFIPTVVNRINRVN